ncbi:aminotransferase class I/II-fold pyridoxal phosphate-dependent enzyme [Vibrio bathopelagicus]
MKLEDLCINYNKSIRDALIMIDNNAHGIVFVVDGYKLLGVVSDGDIRRAIISGKSISSEVADIYNKQCKFLNHNVPIEVIQATLSKRYKIIPLVDDNKKVVDFASIHRLHQTPVLEPLLGGNELEYVTDCVKTNWISSQGKYVIQFEEEVKKYTNSSYALAVSNGTVALHLALVSLGIGEGDEVIVPDITFGATLNAVILAGAQPVIVDVERKTWNISIDLINKNITPNTKAIMPVHIYGIPCNMPEIMNIAKKHDLYVIEDCAEALGSSIKGKHVGTFGDVGTFSFFGNKVITCGEGGALIFRDEDIYNRAKVMRDHGMTPGKRYWHDVVGFNYRLTNLQAAIGCAQFEQLDKFRTKRKQIFSWYDKYLLDTTSFFDSQVLDANYESSYWLYTVTMKDKKTIDRDGLINRLSKLGIDSRPIFYPMSKMPAFRGYRTDLNGESELISTTGISLPTSVYLTESDINRISNEIIDALKSSKEIHRVINENM